MVYYCFVEMHRWPHEYLELSPEEKAVVAACYETRLKAKKEEQRRMEAQTHRKR